MGIATSTMRKKLYVVHEGAVYEAQTSDGGRSYHAYPDKGKLSRSLLEALETIAARKGSIDAFKDWVSRYLEYGGKP